MPRAWRPVRPVCAGRSPAGYRRCPQLWVGPPPAGSCHSPGRLAIVRSVIGLIPLSRASLMTSPIRSERVCGLLRCVRSSMTYQSMPGESVPVSLPTSGGGRSKSMTPPASWIIRLSSSRSSLPSRLRSILPTKANRIGSIGRPGRRIDDVADPDGLDGVVRLDDAGG